MRSKALAKVFLAAALSIWAFFACTTETEADLARVGNLVIKENDFILNYNFGFAHLKQDPDRKGSYFQHMLREKLLAAEAYRRGYADSAGVRESVQRMHREWLLTRFIDAEIKQGIRISEQAISEALMQQSVTFKLAYRYFYDYNSAMAAWQDETGDFARPMPAVEERTTDYLRLADLPAEIQKELTELPIGRSSRPLPLGGGYGLLRILDIRRQGLTEGALKERSAAMEQNLFYAEVGKRLTRYVDSLLTPEEITVDGQNFSHLGRAMQVYAQKNGDWNTFPAAVRDALRGDSLLFAVREKLNDPLIRTKSMQYSLARVLDDLNDGRLAQIGNSSDQMAAALRNTLGNYVRDDFLVREAKAKGLDDYTSFTQAIRPWRDKWVYEFYRQDILDTLQIDTSGVFEWFSQNRQRYRTNSEQEPDFQRLRNRVIADFRRAEARSFLSHQAELLRQRYYVQVDTNRLAEIDVSDSEKSRWMTTQLFVAGSDRLAVPIVDGAWGL